VGPTAALIGGRNFEKWLHVVVVAKKKSIVVCV
jgi:hypothetical protein